MSPYVICDAVWAWDTWACLHDQVGLVRLGVIHEHTVEARIDIDHACDYYPRKVPRCPLCEAGVPRRKLR